MNRWTALRNSVFSALVVLAALTGPIVTDSVSAQETQPAPDSMPIPMVETTTLSKAINSPVSSLRENITADGGTVIEVSLNSVRAVYIPDDYSNVIIGDETIAQLHIEKNKPNQAFIIAKSMGSTNIYFMNDNGDFVKQLHIRVALDTSRIKSTLSKLLPKEDIEVTTFLDTIFLSGIVRSAAAAAQAENIAASFVPPAAGQVKNMLTISGSQQVILKVRVVEMSRTIRKQLSANIGNGVLGNSITFATVSPSATVTDFVSGTISTGNILGNSTFEALEKQSLLKTLAEPTLTAISGKTATFLSGGEIPIRTGTDSNGNAIYEYHEYGISLEFTPVVLDKGRISLAIDIEISSVDSANTIDSIPYLVSKKTGTTIDLPSGGGLMISGLLQDDETNTNSGTPGLKDIPILGALFRSTENEKTEKEMVVTVQAYLVTPVGDEKPLAVPTDGYVPASDIDVYLLGRIHSQYSKGEGPLIENKLAGPYGYIME